MTAAAAASSGCQPLRHILLATNLVTLGTLECVAVILLAVRAGNCGIAGGVLFSRGVGGGVYSLSTSPSGTGIAIQNFVIVIN